MEYILKPDYLTKEAFAPFGDVIETEGRDSFPINNGTTERFHRLADVSTGPDDGRAIISVFRAKSSKMPLDITMLERHPHGSQAFIPLLGKPFLVVVAPATDAPAPEAIRAFVTNGAQGVNYHAGVWHHPVLPLMPVDDFLVVDRTGSLPNCDEHFFPEDVRIVLDPRG